MNPSPSPSDDPIASTAIPLTDRTLATRSARSGVVMIASAAIQTLVGFFALTRLTRLIAPSEFGIYAMAAALLGFIATFRDFGFSAAIVQANEIDDDQLNAIFWLNAKFTGALTAVMLIAIPLAERFFRQPRLIPILIAIVAGIFISNLTLPLTGVLRRRMAFRAIAIIEALAIIFGAMVALISAHYLSGLWALTLQQLAVYLFQTIGIWFASPWRPRSASTKSPEHFRSFSRQLTWQRIIAYIGETFDQFVIGRSFPNTAVLGLYQKSEQWAALPFQQLFAPLTNVVVASFSRVQSDSVRYANFANHVAQCVFAITLPATLFAIIDARELILLLMGPAWIEATNLFRVLILAGLFSVPTMMCRWIFLAEGRTSEQLKWTSFVSTPLMIVGVISGIHWGSIGIAAGYTIALALLFYPTLVFALRNSPLRISEIISPAIIPLLASIAGGAELILLRNTMSSPPTNVAAQLLLHGIIFLVANAFVWSVMPNARANFGRLLNLMSHLRSAPRL